MITQEYLKSILDYNPITGIFTWKETTSDNFNAYAGTEAGYVGKKGYTYIKINQRKYFAHGLAFLSVEGYRPRIVDHKNGLKHDNRWCNLRATSSAINNQNRVAPKKGKLLPIGVTLNYGKYQAYINANKVRYNLGRFDTPEEASEAYWNAKKILHSDALTH